MIFGMGSHRIAKCAKLTHLPVSLQDASILTVGGACYSFQIAQNAKTQEVFARPCIGSRS